MQTNLAKLLAILIIGILSLELLAALPTNVTDVSGQTVSISSNSNILTVLWNVIKGYLTLALWVVIAGFIVAVALMTFMAYSKTNKEGWAPVFRNGLGGLVIIIALIILNIYLTNILA